MSMAPMDPLSLRALAAFLIALSVVSGCAGPIGVRRVSPAEVERARSSSALWSGRLSQSSSNALRRAGILEAYEDDPETVLRTAHAWLVEPGRGDAQLDTSRALVALSEACFLYAERIRDRGYYAQAAVYAWAYLFGTRRPLDPLDPEVRLAAELYNRGLTLALRRPGRGWEVELHPGHFELPFGTALEIEIDPGALRWGDRVLTRFTPVADLEIYGLRNRYRQAGIGAPLAAMSRPLTPGAGPAAQPDDRLRLAVSVLLELDDVMDGLRAGRLTGHLKLAIFPRDESFEIEGGSHPAELEPSATLALALSEIRPWQGEVRALFRGDRRRERDGLRLLNPHREGRIPVVFVHGTASSAATWANLVNELMTDPDLRDRYEFWVFTYNTGAPILYSASLLRRAIDETVSRLDPEGHDPALRQAVVVGHSQGGLLTKLLAVRSGNRFWELVSDAPLEELDMTPETRELIQAAVFVEPSPDVTRVIFIATPHRGSYLLTYGVTNLLRGLVRAPSTVLQATTDLVRQNAETVALRRIDDVEGALGQMNPSSPFLERLLEMPIEDPIAAHSIIAMKELGPKEEASDGVVRYESARLDDVESEVVVESGHSCLDQPAVVAEVRRILRMHLALLGR